MKDTTVVRMGEAVSLVRELYARFRQLGYSLRHVHVPHKKI